jgi:DNA-binding transcriptional ArsR family regulator
MPNQSKALNSMFQALADPTRREIVRRLCEGPATVSELSAPFKMALPSFVQHLQVLEQSGLITSEKVGRVRTCRVALERIADAEAWFESLRALWDERFAQLDT